MLFGLLKRWRGCRPGVVLLCGFSAVGALAADLEIRGIQLMSEGQAHLTIDAPADQTHSFLVSTNLRDWNPAGSLSPVSSDGQTATYLIELNSGRPMTAYQVVYEIQVTDPEPIALLAGPANDPAMQHLPDMGMPRETPEEVRMLDVHIPVSIAHILATFKESTTVQAFNSLLQSENLSIAGAVPVMNLVLLRRNAVTDLDDLAEQLVVLENTGLFSEVAPNLGMRASPVIAEPVPQLNSAGGSLAPWWTWEADGIGTGSGGNNAFELSRIPQLWNWMDHGHRQNDRFGGHDIAVLEFGFYNHDDLGDDVTLGVSADRTVGDLDRDHGAAVVGIIAADKGNGYAIQGVTSLADQVRGVPFLVNNTVTNSYASTDLWLMSSLLTNSSPPKVFSISSGFTWTRDPNSTTNSPGVTDANWVDSLGALWTDAFEALNSTLANADYLVVACAGNENASGAGRESDARYQSPMANIACRPALLARVPNFITVEAVDGDKSPADYSNYNWLGDGDFVSAGGSGFITLAGPGGTDFDYNGSGTSYATPMVSGLASFLWSLDPTLTIGEMKSLLTATNTTQEIASGTRGNLVDGFAAALEIDVLRGNRAIHKALVDVDDGTLDGNLREALVYFSEDPDLIHTPDGRRGDGKINMKDFRVFRDAWLQVIGETNALDGPSAHFKRDLNFDGLVEDQPASPPHPAPYEIVASVGTPLNEAIYSRYDFNGNGRLDIETQAAFPPVESLGPFRVDPDKPVTGRSISQGFYRDIDVLLSRDIWEQDEENVVLNNAPPYPSTLPFDWTTNDLSTLYISDLQSFDFHLDMEGGNPDAVNDNYNDHPFYPVQEGLEIWSYGSLTKGRMGEWEGVITIPYDVIFDVPTVYVQYRKTVGDEFHQYFICHLATKGEDVALTVAFDDLQFYSNTREFTSFYLEESSNPVSTEVIAKTPDGGTYGGFFIPLQEATSQEIQNRARDAAVEALADRLIFPVALNGSPALEAIYKTDTQEGGVFVEIYGITASFNVIEGTPIER